MNHFLFWSTLLVFVGNIVFHYFTDKDVVDILAVSALSALLYVLIGIFFNLGG